MLLFLAIPFFKLRTLMPRERYRFADLVAMIVVTVVAAGLGAIVLFVRAPTSAGDATLDRFYEEIEGHLERETRLVLARADEIMRHQEQIEARLVACTVSGSRIRGADGSVDENKKQCGLWQALGVKKAPIELDVVLWFNEHGDQVRKWTTKQQITGPASHRPFDHYRDVTSGRLWTLKSSTYEQGIRSPSNRYALQLPRSSASCSPCRFPCAVQERLFLGLNGRPQSLVDPIVPTGLWVRDRRPQRTRAVSFEESLSLEENFFEEVGDSEQVRQRARSNRLTRWMGDYHGRPHRFRMQPVQTLLNSPWLIVTFQELEPELAQEVLQQSGTLRLGFLNLVYAGRHRPGGDEYRSPSMANEGPAAVGAGGKAGGHYPDGNAGRPHNRRTARTPRHVSRPGAPEPEHGLPALHRCSGNGLPVHAAGPSVAERDPRHRNVVRACAGFFLSSWHCSSFSLRYFPR